MRLRVALLLVTALAAVYSPLYAQSLAEASAEAKKVTHDWPVSMNAGPPAAPPVTAAELTDLDRSKFAGVHVAAAAATDALTLEGLPGKTEAIRTMREFKTEASLTLERAVTKAEKALAQQYYDAQFDFDMSDQMFAIATGHGYVNHETLEKSKDLRTKAWASLKAADRIYLGKAPK